MEVLQGKGRSGDFVHNGQEMAGDFRNVSSIWRNKCIGFEDGIRMIEEGYSKTEDLKVATHAFNFKVGEKDKFVVEEKGTGRVFAPTEHALSQMSTVLGCGTNYTNKLYKGDSGDQETLARVINNGVRKLPLNKKFMWRTRQDGTLRAFLSEGYTPIANLWYLKALKRIIPGGLLSHWRGDSDTIRGNILIPDSIRKEDDSDYGGMTAVGNSEIGLLRIYSEPSVFRAICQNGCIWDRETGQAFSKVHKGHINLDELFVAIKENIEGQIPLITKGIEKLLGTKRLGWDGASILPAFVQIGKDFDLVKKEVRAIHDGYQEEVLITPSSGRSLFGLINGMTRVGQQMSNDQWVKFDRIAGRLVNMGADEWRFFQSKASKLSMVEVDKYLVEKP